MTSDNRIDRRFAELAASGRKGLIPFVTAGDPDPGSVVPLLHALATAGADLIELGIPFSDPMADGPVIQRASERALARGVTLSLVLDWVRAFREEGGATPIVLMGYLNPVECFGVSRFAAAAAAAGVDGVLLVDCPLEEAAPYREALGEVGIHQILLAAPTTEARRRQAIARATRGFLYYVAFAGVTGADRLDPSALAVELREWRAVLAVPLAVGFGIKTAQDAAAVAGVADAVVVGSALVEALHRSDDPLAAAASFLAPLRAVLDARAGVGAGVLA